MTSLHVRCGAIALLVAGVPVFGGPVALDFGSVDNNTWFEAEMGYNTDDPAQWPTAQSESDPPTPDDSLHFPNGDYWDNLLFENGTPIDQAWSVAAHQTYEQGSQYPTLHFTFGIVYASPISADYPLMIGLQNLNDVSSRSWSLVEPVTGSFKVAGVTVPWTLDSGVVQSGGPQEYDLTFDFGIPSDMPGIEPGNLITRVELALDVTPEPGTFMLLATALLVCGRRRRRQR